MRVRASYLLMFALLSAPVVNAAVAMTAGARNTTKYREHPVAGKPAKTAARGSHVPERDLPERLASRSSSHSAPAHPSKETHPSKAEAREERLHPSRSGRLVAAKEEREPRADRERTDRKYARRHLVLETREVKGRKITTAKAASAEPVKIARAMPAPIMRAESETPAPQPAAIESDPEAANVVHDRKIHRSAEEGEPRKAAPSDFMNEAPGKPVPSESAPIPPPAIKPAAMIPTRSKSIPTAIAKATAAPEPPPVLVAVSYRHGRLVVPPALKGSHEILVHQNEMADSEGLERIRDDDDLEDMRASKLLVPIPAVQGMQIDERLPANRRYTRPWTAAFLSALARAHYQRFHTALQVNSAVRTVEFQERLMMTNGNAAPAEGATASPHLTGQAVDLAKHGLSMTEIAWLRGYLLPLVQQGKVDVEEEFQQACFHVSVYRKYMPQSAPRRTIVARHGAATALAAALP